MKKGAADQTAPFSRLPCPVNVIPAKAGIFLPPSLTGTTSNSICSSAAVWAGAGVPVFRSPALLE